MRHILKLVAGLSVLLGIGALSAAPAGAATGYVNLCHTSSSALCTASAEHEFNSVAIDESGGSTAGDVWVANVGHGLVAFDSLGSQITEITGSAMPPSAEDVFVSGHELQKVAVDPTDGDVYVAGNVYGMTGSVTKFNPSGVFQFQISGSNTPQGSFKPIGIAVGATGDLYVADSVHQVIDEFDSSGKYLEQLSLPLPAQSEYLSFALDSVGDIYVGFIVKGDTEVAEYSPAGTPVNCPSGSNVLAVDPAESVNPTGRIAVDPGNGHIFVGADSAAEGEFIAEYSSICATAPNARAGGKELATVGRFAVSSNHELYVSSFTSVVIFGTVILPDVTTSASPTGITRTSAVVNGSVNPDGTQVTACEFEYGTTTTYGQTVPCAQPLPLEGNSPVQVSAEIKGLSLPPASSVHYRLKVGTANGTNEGEGQMFYTESLPSPVVGDLPAVGVSQFAATLEGTLATGEALVNYHFVYGTTTAYGSVAPIPDGYTPITNETLTVSQPVQGLQAGTTYHYRLIASSPGGTEVASPDETFTTLPIPAPTVATGGASGVGVGSVTLSGTIDPHGWDTMYLFQYGTSTAYGQSWPTVPVEMGALEGAQPVVVNVPNLVPGATYHYRLVAVDGGGTSYGQDMTFTTGEYPAQAIQEPPTVGTLLVPSEPGKVASSTKKKQQKRGTMRGKKKRRRRATRSPRRSVAPGARRAPRPGSRPSNGR